MDKKIRVLITLGILILIVVGFYLSSFLITKYTGYSITGKKKKKKNEKIQLGNCLKNKNVTLYCTSLSLNCLRQRNSLGLVYNYVKYVDCSENFDECKDLIIPAWKIRNHFYYGIHDLERLAKLSGCQVR